MNRPRVTNGENRQPKRVDIYEEFVLWSSMPPSERFKLGIETQEQFVEFYKIGINTPTAWKRRPDFEARVTLLRREWAFSRTSAVIEGIYRAALKGNPFSQKLWLQYFHNFSEKQIVAVAPARVGGVNDVLALIEALPENRREKHYAWLREFIYDASIAKQKAQEDGDMSAWDQPMPEGWQPRYRLVDSEATDEESLEDAPVSKDNIATRRAMPTIRASAICDAYSQMSQKGATVGSISGASQYSTEATAGW